MRHCDECTLCCKLMGLHALRKPKGVWCPHCDIGVGCKIYQQRPEPCRTFECRYLVDTSLPDEWQPARCGMVVNRDPGRVVIQVDVDRSDVWRGEPYYSTIKQWARTSLPGWPVFLCIGERIITVYATHEQELPFTLRSSGGWQPKPQRSPVGAPADAP